MADLLLLREAQSIFHCHTGLGEWMTGGISGTIYVIRSGLRADKKV